MKEQVITDGLPRSHDRPEGERAESRLGNHLPPLDMSSAKRDAGGERYVVVSAGQRRVEAADGDGRLKAVEEGSANGLPDGRYDLAKAIEAKNDGDRTYDGHVLHQDKGHVFHLVGEEVVKHSLFDLAKEKLPDIGARLTVAYGAGVAQVAAGPAVASISAPRVEQRGQTTIPDARHDIDALFRLDPRSLGHERLATQQMQQIESRLNTNTDYAVELKKLAPDLFNQLAGEGAKATVAERERIVKAVEVVERVDQAKTVSELGGRSEGQHPEAQQHQREKEKRGFSVPDPIRTSVESRVQAARDLLNKAHTLQPMYATNQQREHAPSRQKAPAKVKRGMSR